jgi:hypothetical protein
MSPAIAENVLSGWLTCADPVSRADLIFAVAGRRARKSYALDLFEQGFAPRLLLSVGRFEIRRLATLKLPVPVDLLALASSIPPPQRHFFVGFEGGACQVERIPVRTFGTLNEIEALAGWLAGREEIRSLLIVSSGVHLRRVRMCCRTLLRRRLREGLRINFLAAPAAEAGEDGKLEPSPWSELMKLPVYRAVLATRHVIRRD